MAIPVTVLPKPVLDILKRYPALYAAGRRVRFAFGSFLGSRAVPGITGPVHFNDFMFDNSSAEDAAAYSKSARQFISILGRSLKEVGRAWSDVNSVLEVGCGFGRVVRELRWQQPDVEIYVNDVIDEGARFTASEFNARRLPLLEKLPEPCRNRFDLIYLLSIYTHMPRDMVARNISLVADALRPGGVVVFTVHGEGSARMAQSYDIYWLDQHRVMEGLAREGYYYQRYPYYQSECGMTWFSPDAIRALVSTAAPKLHVVSHHAMDIDGHQDIYVYQRH